MKRFFAALFILSLLVGLLPTVSLAASGRLEISVPTGVSVTLKDAFAGSGRTVSADSTSTSGGYKTYIYEDLSTGTYSFTASGNGYNTLKKDIYYISGTIETIVKDPGKMSNGGWEAGSGIERNDEIIGDDGLFASTTTAWPGYEFVFNTPVFTDSSIAKQQFTPHATMLSFIKGLMGNCSNMYYYKVGTSPTYGYEMPLIVFTKTDLTGKTMEEAGSLLQAGGKPIVFHQAQVHGNEPAAGEGSLALIYAAATGNLKDYNGGDILDSVDILVFPRINADGSRNFQRENVADGLNMNRGYLSMRSSEIQDLITVYNAFRPHIVMDAHEWTPDNTSEVSYFDDLWLFTCGSGNNSEIQLNTGIEIMENVFSDAQKQGIRPQFYSRNMTYGTDSNSLAPYYYGLRGSYAFCVETRGIGIGRGCYERRVMSHYLTAESMIRYAAANAQEVVAKCKEERARIAAAGSVYGSDDPLVLKHETTTYSKAYPRPTLDLKTNKITNPNATFTPSITCTPNRTRPRPTAYLIKAGASGLSKILSLMDYHGIPYIKLDESMNISVKQYSGNGKSASLSSELSVSFGAGSYLFPMNHSDGNILAMIMEPDVNDTYSSESYSTLVQRGILSSSSIYRYEGNLDKLFTVPDAPTGLSVIQPTITVPTGTITGLDASRSYEYRAEDSATYIPVPAGSTQIPSLYPGKYCVRFAATESAQASKDCVLTVDPQPQAEVFTVSFYHEDGSLLNTQEVVDGDRVIYDGETPSKAYTDEIHYVFEAWVDKDGNPAKMDSITADCDFYATFSEGEHNYSTKTTLEPTCTTEGSVLHSCSVCGRSYEEVLPAAGHSTELQNEIVPTCTSTGYSGDKVCTVCNTVVEKGSFLPMAEHTEQIVPGYPATCLGSGLTDGKICTVCGTTLLAQTVTPRLGHSYVYTDNGDGTHTGSCERCSKTLSPAAHSFDENGICQLCCAEEAADPAVDPSIEIRHTLNLASDISINYVVAASQLADYDSYYLECVLPVYNGNELVDSSTVRIEPVLKGSYYYFTLTGVTAVQMGDEIEATLYLRKDGAPYVSPADSYSVAAYAYSQLDKVGVADSLKTLCADLLCYGSAAQTFKGYRTDALADAAMTPEQMSYLSDLETVTFGNNNAILDDVDIPEITWAGKSLNLESKVVLKFIIETASYTGAVEDLSLRVSYKDYTGQDQTVFLSEPTAYGSSGTRYAFDFDGLLAAELRSTVDVAVFAGETQLSSTLRYSADTYGNGKTGTLLTLCKALVAYSDSAKAYFVN